MWARSVCLNAYLELGSVLPQLEYAEKHRLSVIVMNPNVREDEEVKEKGRRVDEKIYGMEKHSTYVWEHFVHPYIGSIEKILMIAHSAGGRCAAEIIKKFQDDAVNKIKCLAFTDAC